MPVLHSIIHKIDKKPDGSPAILHYSGAELAEIQARDELINQFNESYNAKAGKAWGFFHAESGAFPLSGWLGKYLAGDEGFVSFSDNAVEHLTKLMEESNLSVGGNVLFCHYQQGLTDYLIIALVQETEAVAMTDGLTLLPIRRLDLDHIHLAARINLSEWKNNPASRQYISFIKGKNGRKASDYFRDFIGCQEGVDGPGETRTLLKAFSDFVESEDLGEESAREKTNTLVNYSMAQAKLGEPITLEELSGLIDEDQPKTFYDFIKAKDYGLSETLPPDKKTLNKFRRFTGRIDGLSISFEQHLLGSKVEFDEAGGTLTLRCLPTQLTDQLKRAAA
jgi:nucleoid-associated protein